MLFRSSVETLNICPAPSQSFAVMIGVCIQLKPCSWKKLCVAMARQLRTRVTAPNVFVLMRRCATSLRYSNVWRFAATGYVSGSWTRPVTCTWAACISQDWPLPCDATSLPVTMSEAPVVSFRIFSW